MPSMLDIKVAPGQGDAIKGVHDVNHQTPNQKRFPAAKDRKEKEKKKDGTKGDPGSEEQCLDSASKSKKKTVSEVRGGLVDVII